MATAKSRKAKAVSTPAPVLSGSGYVTVDFLQSLGLDPTDPAVQQDLNDANDVYQVIQAQQGISQVELVGWANGALANEHDVSPIDRLNTALALLKKLGLILSLGQ